MIHSHRLEDLQVVKTFLLAGNAIFTIRNTNSKNHITYKLRKPKKLNANKPDLWWASVMTGNDNEKSYTFIGTVYNGGKGFKYKSKINPTDKRIIVFQGLLNFIYNNETLPKGVEIWHEGSCGKCGRKLTRPESIITGLGPECGSFKYSDIVLEK